MSDSNEKTYRIGTVARELKIRTSVLRFWEKSFPQFESSRSEKGQRLYTENDIALLRQIRQLLYEQGLTIKGAKKVLEEKNIESENTAIQVPARADGELVLMIRDELREIRKFLTGTEEK